MVALSRRAMLLGGVAVVGLGAGGVASGVLPGRGELQDLLHPLPPGVPRTSPGRVDSGSFTSAAMHGTVGWSIAHPPGLESAALPVLLTLHGRGEDHRYAFDTLDLQYFLAAAHHRYAIASVDGADHDYWHPRSFADPAAMVVTEFLPLLGRRGLDVGRLGLLGWSMGGYGALYLGGVLGPGRVRAVVAESPAIWHQADQSAAGAFDDTADFDAHAIFGHLDRLQGLSLRVDCGASDGFAAVTRDLRAALSPPPAGGIEPGGHDADYWRSQAAAQLAFVADRLQV